MISLLGASPVSSATTAGLNAFRSLLSPKPSKAFGADSSRYPRAYTATRGLLIDKKYLQGVIDPSNGYQFQFNPAQIQDIKEANWSSRGYLGLDYNDYIWGGGGERTISFQLFLDNTPQSKTTHFRPSDVNKSEVANGLVTKGTLTAKNYPFKGLVDDIVSTGKTIGMTTAQTFAPKLGPSKFEWERPDARKTRVNERGILEEVEKIQAFMHPAPIGNEKPLFASGGVVSANTFRPPSTAVFVLGPNIYMEGIIKSAPVTYTLFDEDLTPIRATIDIELAVFEFENLQRPNNL